jgi:MFS family permease
MGAVAYYSSNQAIFFLTAAFGIPALLALAQIRSADIDPDLARGGTRHRESGRWFEAFADMARSRALLVFVSAIVLFQLSNAALLPIMAGSLTNRVPESAAMIVAICILAPQFVVAAIAPWVGRLAQSIGRRPLLTLCFLPLCIRSAMFATSPEPLLIVAVQLLDGISAAILGVLVPLIIADITRGTGHFAFAQGVIGVAVGIGAALGTTLAGFIADRFGDVAAFMFLGSVGGCGVLLAFALMPETREARVASPG